VLYGLLTGISTGVWPLLAPHGFYTDFPGGPWQGWVAMDGPYNEHLIRDFGGLNLAMAAVLVGVAVLGRSAPARLTGLAVLLFAVPHTAYHWMHADHFPPADRVPAVGAAAIGVLVGVLVLVLPSRKDAAAAEAAAAREAGTARAAAAGRKDAGARP